LIFVQKAAKIFELEVVGILSVCVKFKQKATKLWTKFYLHIFYSTDWLKFNGDCWV